MMRVIATVADHPEYTAGVFVLVKHLRFLGCKLPIQIWHADDRPNCPIIAPVLESLGATFHPLPNTRAFHAKCFPAIWPTMQNENDDVMYLDSDSYPIYDPTVAFDWPEYHKHKALFWPNFRGVKIEAWAKMGLIPPREQEFETGQYIVNTGVCSDALFQGHAHCNDPTIFGPIFRDDQECLHTGYVKTNTPYEMIKTLPKRELHTIINHDPQGNVFTQHRVADKFRLKNYRYWTKQRCSRMIFHKTLKWEKELFDIFAEYADLIGHEGILPGFAWCDKTKRRLPRYG